ncbi:MAG: hypothetical protein O6939_08215, partial [Bacteroidetes bacterium]|nr:hypothetical protein [Bacteroidota bacterium]
MKTLNNIPIIGLLLAFFSGCGGDDSGSGTTAVDEIDPAFNITAVDIANNGNGADIEISFVKPSTTGIAEFRITIVKSSQSGGYDLNTANGVPPGNYFSVDKDVSGVKINLGANTNDTDGESIVNGIGYNVFMLSVAEANSEVEN